MRTLCSAVGYADICYAFGTESYDVLRLAIQIFCSVVGICRYYVMQLGMLILCSAVGFADIMFCSWFCRYYVL